MHRPLAALVATLTLVLAACGGADVRPAVGPLDPRPVSETESPNAAAVALEAAEREDQTVALFLGTLHERHYLADYSLDVVEEVVRRFEPDVVLVELPPEDVDEVCDEVDRLGADAGPSTLSNRWIKTLPELYRVVIPLRDELGYDVVGISGWTGDAFADRASYYDVHPHGPATARQYIVANAAFHAAFLQADGWNDPRWLHSDEYMETLSTATRWLSYHAEEDMGLGGAMRVPSRHTRLLDEALDAHAGERVLVVFDITARWVLEPLLDMRSDVRRTPVERWLP